MRNPLTGGGRRSRNSSSGSVAGRLPKKWSDSRALRTVITAIGLALPIAVVVSSSASAGVNLVVNAGLGQSSSGFPVCFSKAGNGTSAYRFYNTSKAHSGSAALEVSVSGHKSGERLAQITESQTCAPYVIPGHQYNLGVWYMSSTPDTVIELYRHDEKKGWVFWMDLKTLPATGKYQNASVRTPVVPAATDQISFGVALYGNGNLITDDYSMSDATVKASATSCSAGTACTKGVWQVLPFPSRVRSIHAVLMYNGKVLFVAGSGNDPDEFAAGTFESAVYDPTTGKFQVIPTPDDFFCAGHVQLANGNVLVLGGNKAYPDASNTHGYEGLNTSYIFDPVTDKYIKENNLNGGHWYPSATEFGDAEHRLIGGLDQNSGASILTEYFKYDQSLTDSTPDSSTDGKWLPKATSMKATATGACTRADDPHADGELFYSGSHVFDDNMTPVGDNGGPDPWGRR